MTELPVGNYTGAEPCTYIYLKQIQNKLQIYCDNISNGWHSDAFYTISAKPSADGKRAPLNSISVQRAGYLRVWQGSSAHIYCNDVVIDKIKKRMPFFHEITWKSILMAGW